MEITYSNPRMEATIHDWPSGNKRVTARFEMSRPRRVSGRYGPPPATQRN